MAVFEKVQEIIVEELGKEVDEVKMETTFDELDADSLDVFQVISEIEDAFDIQIETEEGLNTVGDLVAYVEEKQNNNMAGVGIKKLTPLYLVGRAVG
ncbi:Acyl carrier protein [Streptococcus sp. HSISB1]|nr:Acyl carrier protein [Streptococcus sp. HSISB1]